MLSVWILVVTHLAAPVVLLWLGHGYHDRSLASKRLFWGGVVGYVASIVVVTTLLLVPPVFWEVGRAVRWVAIQWTPLVLPLVVATGARLLLGGARPGAVESGRAV
jgi:hypothetical protein